MKKNDFLNLDGNSLKVFITVFDEMSLSKAAERLGISQSGISHSLDKLRELFDDPLFIRSGRGISATEFSHNLRLPAQTLLDDLIKLKEQKEFDPIEKEIEFTIAANDFQRSLIFPELLNNISKDNIRIKCRFVHSGVPSVKLLNQSLCDIAITPLPPDGNDIYQRKLFESKIVCFFDASIRKAPKTLEEVLQSDFVDIKFNDTESAYSVLPFTVLSQMKEPEISVPNFSAAEEFILGTPRIGIVLELMKFTHFKQLDYAELPFDTENIPMFIVWHRRNHTDPSHIWFREAIISHTKEAVKKLYI